jgi:glycosyltransferase involved in cell wall biosynthesis
MQRLADQSHTASTYDGAHRSASGNTTAKRRRFSVKRIARVTPQRDRAGARGAQPVASLRLLHVCQPTDGGAAIATAQLARVAVDHGFGVTVMSPNSRDLPAMAVTAGAHWIGLEMRRTPAPSDFRAIVTIRRQARASDILHLHSSKAGALGRIAIATLPMNQRPRVVFTPHGWGWYGGGFAAPIYRVFERIAARWADVIVAVSDREAADGAQVLADKSNRIRVIWNGVETEEYRPLESERSHPAGALVIVVGRFHDQKGQDLAVRALARIGDKRVRMRLVGEGPTWDSIQALVHSLGLSDRVDMTGKADSRRHLQEADIVLVPSRWEGMSLLLLEAMSCGCAIVATESAGLEVLGDAGVVVKGDDLVGAMATAVSGLIRDPARCSVLRRAARTRAVELYSFDRVAREYISVWAE